MGDDEDVVGEMLEKLEGQLPEPRLNLSKSELKKVIALVGGPRTALNILKAKKDFSLDRIPFLFCSLDTQAVVDLLANDSLDVVNSLLS